MKIDDVYESLCDRLKTEYMDLSITDAVRIIKQKIAVIDTAKNHVSKKKGNDVLTSALFETAAAAVSCIADVEFMKENAKSKLQTFFSEGQCIFIHDTQNTEKNGSYKVVGLEEKEKRKFVIVCKELKDGLFSRERYPLEDYGRYWTAEKVIEAGNAKKIKNNSSLSWYDLKKLTGKVIRIMTASSDKGQKVRIKGFVKRRRDEQIVVCPVNGYKELYFSFFEKDKSWSAFSCAQPENE